MALECFYICEREVEFLYVHLRPVGEKRARVFHELLVGLRILRRVHKHLANEIFGVESISCHVISSKSPVKRRSEWAERPLAGR